MTNPSKSATKSSLFIGDFVHDIHIDK